MNTKCSLVIALLATAFAFPALAGPGLNLSARPARTFEAPPVISAAERSQPATKPVVQGGFEEIGGEAGWQLAQHRYVLKDGKFVHGNECDLVIRSARATTSTHIESGSVESPGA